MILRLCKKISLLFKETYRSIWEKKKKKKENLEREREADDKHLFASPPFGKPTSNTAQKYKKE